MLCRQVTSLSHTSYYFLMNFSSKREQNVVGFEKQPTPCREKLSIQALLCDLSQLGCCWENPRICALVMRVRCHSQRQFLIWKDTFRRTNSPSVVTSTVPEAFWLLSRDLARIKQRTSWNVWFSLSRRRVMNRVNMSTIISNPSHWVISHRRDTSKCFSPTFLQKGSFLLQEGLLQRNYITWVVFNIHALPLSLLSRKFEEIYMHCTWVIKLMKCVNVKKITSRKKSLTSKFAMVSIKCLLELQLLLGYGTRVCELIYSSNSPVYSGPFLFVHTKRR